MKSFSRPWEYRRRPTCEVGIGEVGVGGRQPIRVQSMTTPATHDVDATVEQIRRLVEAGCEIVRVTVPSTRDAEALPEIRRRLENERIRVPLVADIHFSPAAAMLAVEHVEKVRINPGNYADTKRFKIWEYTDAEYEAELARLEQRFKPLVLRAKERGVALRIGTNHGSLSDRILNRYGDTPLGMVESALEFVRICERHGHRSLILSMKSSNPMVMIQAYRLLAARMAGEGMDYPFHLGVTEAGDGEDGRIKSAVGIGALLEEGIGDTIRVSLTEDPVAEIPVAFALVEKYNRHLSSETISQPPRPSPASPGATYTRRLSTRLAVGPVALGESEPVRVECVLKAPLTDAAAVEEELRSLAGSTATPDAKAEILEVPLSRPGEIPHLARLVEALRSRASGPAVSAALGGSLAHSGALPLEALAGCARITLALSTDAAALRPLLRRAARDLGLALHLEARVADESAAPFVQLVDLARWCRDEAGSLPLLSLDIAAGISPIVPYRCLASVLSDRQVDAPLLLRVDASRFAEDPLLFSSVYLGSLLCDGVGDAVRVEGYLAPEDSLRLAFNILQGTRLRLVKTEFISCPSCGRTQFDLEETTRRIKARTAHLKGVKIAIMGCIVNGPGEMADADFGYVGWGPGKVSLFVGKDLIEKDIPYAEADERLVRLIKSHGRWTEPPVAAPSAPLPVGGARD